MHVAHELTKAVHDFLEELVVYDCGMNKVRVGNDHDGGYILLRELCQSASVLYSFGIGDDVSFELDFANRFPVKEVFLYDPYVEELPEEHPVFRFSNKGFGRKWEPVKLLHKGEAVLKIDIEWDEWDALFLAHGTALRTCSQLVIEFHVVNIGMVGSGEYSPYFEEFYQNTAAKINARLFEKYASVMRKLCRDFHIFHIHANNSLPVIEVGGFIFPPLMELSFVRKDLVTVARKTKAHFPVDGLDFPNKTDRADIEGYYPFDMDMESGPCWR